MNASSRPASLVSVILGLLALGGVVPAPAGGAAEHASDFVVEVTVEDSSGRAAARNGVDLDDCPLVITANVTVAGGRPDSLNTTAALSVNGEPVESRSLGPVYRSSSPGFALCSYCWTPPSHGDYDIEVSVQNGDDRDNRTVLVIPCLTVRSPDLWLTQVFSDRISAVIGRTEVAFFAGVENRGNADGPAHVDFRLDGRSWIGDGEEVVRAGSRDHVILRKVFLAGTVAAGAHTVTGTLAGQDGAGRTSGRINFRLPLPGLEVTTLEVAPAKVRLARNGVAPVNLTASVANSGNCSQSGFGVVFFDGNAPVASVRVDRPVAPGCAVLASCTWEVPERTETGLHNLSAGLDWQDPVQDALPKAILTVVGPGGVAVSGLAVSPDTQYEGREVVLSALVVNLAGTDATCRTVQFRLAGAAGGLSVIIGRTQNINIPAGGSTQVGLAWTLPSIENDNETRTVEALMDGTVQSVAAVTILKCRPVLELTGLSVPEGLRVGDIVILSADVRNAGNAPLKGLRVIFSDGNVSLSESEPFNLLPGDGREVRVAATIPGPGDRVHSFTARAADAEMTKTREVGHRLAPANIEVAGFSVDPDIAKAPSGDFVQDLILLLVLRNTGEVPGTASVSIIDGDHKSVVKEQGAFVPPGNNTTRPYLWTVKGGGRHAAYVTVVFEERSQVNATGVDIPWGPPEADLPQVAAAGTGAVLVALFVLAVAGTGWKARRARAGPAPGRAVKRAVPPPDFRVEREPRFDERSGAPPRSCDRQAWPEPILAGSGPIRQR